MGAASAADADAADAAGRLQLFAARTRDAAASTAGRLLADVAANSAADTGIRDVDATADANAADSAAAATAAAPATGADAAINTIPATPSAGTVSGATLL